MSHFLAIGVGFYDSSTIVGIYPTFEAAREDVEKRTQLVKDIKEQAAANRKKSASLGDPGPYVPSDECGVEGAQIEEWDGREYRGKWERTDYRHPLNWIRSEW